MFIFLLCITCMVDLHCQFVLHSMTEAGTHNVMFSYNVSFIFKPMQMRLYCRLLIEQFIQ